MPSDSASKKNEFLPRVLALELTRRCNLNCIHCRASAGTEAPVGELSLEEYEHLFASIASFSSPIIILSGGEPLLRPDVFDIAAAARRHGLQAALSTNGTLLTENTLVSLREAGIKTCSISVDGSSAEIHDDFRQQPGAFAASMKAVRLLQAVGFKVQINTSLTRRNQDDLPNIFRLVKDLKAAAWHVFLLVPTGRGAADEELITAADYEQLLNYLYERNRDETMEIKPTCAPQYYRILRERARAEGLAVEAAHFGLNARTRGCLAGMGFAFISYRGEVFPCGYYPRPAGDIRQQSFRQIWEEAELFRRLRDFKNYKGPCGHCAYLGVCGGCRARAYALRGDDFAPEPYCEHGEKLERKRGGSASGEKNDGGGKAG